MADSVELAFEALDKVTGPMQRMAQQANRLKETLARINSADKMALGVMRSKTQLMQEQIRAANRLQIAQLRANKAAMPKAPTGGGLGFLGALGAVGLGVGIADLVQGVLRLGAAFVRMGVEAGAAFGKAVFGAALFREQSVTAFRALSKGASDGVKEFERVRNLAFDFGVPLEDAVTQFQSLQRMGFAMKDAERLFKRMQDLRVVGATTDQLNRAVLAITQIKATGKLQGDELLQLAEAGVSIDEVYKALGKRLNKTVPEIIKLKEAGKIGAADAIASVEDAIAKMTGGKAAGQLGKDIADNTISGMFGRLKTGAGFFLDEIAKRANGAFQKLKPIFEDVFAFLKSKDATDIFDAIGEGFTALFTAARDAWPFVKQFLRSFKEGFGSGFEAGWQSVKVALDAMKKAMGGDSATQMENIARAAKAAGMAVGFLAAGFIGMVAVAAQIARGISLVTGKIRELVTSISDLGGAWDKLTGKMGMLGVDGPKSLFGKAGPALPTASSLTAASMTGTTPAPAVQHVTNNNTPNISISVSGLTVENLAQKIRDIVIAQLKQQFGGSPT